MTDTAAQQLIGNRYILGKKLGAGGMGAVYKAQDRLSGEIVALKRVTVATTELTFNSRAQAKTDLRVALAQEFQTLASLRHPHIISVLDYGFDRLQQPYFTMTLLEDANDIRKAASTADDLGKATLFLQMLQAIAYLHRRGIVHRDLKPGNVLVDAQQQIKVLDFGLAVQGETAKGISGTLTYMAPEILQNKGASPLSDLYAAGMIAYEIFAGVHPFNTRNLSQLVRDILSKVPDFDLMPEYLDIDRIPENAITLDAIIGRLLMKSPPDRYTNAMEVIKDLALLMNEDAIESYAIRESYLQAARFIGRERELQQLTDALQRATQGHGSLWLISGESGVGKSRLIEEVRTRALVQGVTVLRAQETTRTSTPYQIWQEPVRRLLLSAEVSDLEASILKLVVPDIGRILQRPIEDAAPLDGADTQKRLALTIAHLFTQHKQPILLVLEDLHWSTDSLEPLHQINRFAATHPLLVIGSYRSDEDTDVAALLPQMQRIALDRLTSQHIDILATSMLGNSAKPEVIDLLMRETEGNVYFIVETVRALAEDAGALEDVGIMTLPSSVFAGGVQEVVRRRLSRVPEQQLPLLYLAAIMGREIDFKLLTQLVNTHKALQATDVSTWLTICANVLVFENIDERWVFAHDKLREVILRDLDIHTKPALYRQVAEATEQVYPDDVTRAALLADYWRVAGYPSKVIHYAHIAAHYALRIGNFVAARKHLQEVLDLLKQHPDTTIELQTLKQMGDAYEGVSDYVRAIENYEASLALSRSLGHKEGIVSALVGLGEVAQKRADYETALDCHTRALAIARTLNQSSLLANALNGLGTIAAQLGQLEEARAYFNESLSLRRTMQDQKGIAASLNNLGIIHRFSGEVDNAIQCLTESLATRRQIGDQRGIASSLSNLGITARNKQDYQAARAYYEESVAIFREIGDQRGIASALNNLASITREQQDYEASTAFYNESLQIARRIGDQRAIGYALHNLGRLAKAQKRYEQAIQYLEQSLVITQQQSDRRAVAEALDDLGTVLHDLGRTEEALDNLRRSYDLYLEVGDQRGAIAVLKNLAQADNDRKATSGYYRLALRKARHIKAQDLIIDLVSLLADHALEQSNYDLAHTLMEVVAKQGPLSADVEQRLTKIRRRLDILQPRQLSQATANTPQTLQDAVDHLLAD